MSPQYGELGPLAVEIVSLVWGTPGNFNGFCVLAALLHGTLVVGISQTLRHWTFIFGRAAITLGSHSSYCLFYLWHKYDITVTVVTLMSCDSICCMCGEAWGSRWLMIQLINGQHACVLVFVPMVNILNISCDRQFVFSVLDELCFTPCLMQWVVF